MSHNARHPYIFHALIVLPLPWGTFTSLRRSSKYTLIGYTHLQQGDDRSQVNQFSQVYIWQVFIPGYFMWLDLDSNTDLSQSLPVY